MVSYVKVYGDMIRCTYFEIGVRLLSYNMWYVVLKDKYGFYVEDVEGGECLLCVMIGIMYGRIYDYDVV